MLYQVLKELYEDHLQPAREAIANGMDPNEAARRFRPGSKHDVYSEELIRWSKDIAKVRRGFLSTNSFKLAAGGQCTRRLEFCPLCSSSGARPPQEAGRAPVHEALWSR